MKELGQHLHKNADQRIRDVRDLIGEMEKMERVKQKMDEWKIKLEKEPLEC